MSHGHAPAFRWLPLIGAVALLALGPRLATAQPVVDGTITESLYVSAGTALNTNAGFGPDITVREILYYADPVGEHLYVALRGTLNVGSGDGIGLLLGFSELDGRNAGDDIGGTIPNGGHFFGGELFTAFAADFDVRYGFAVNPGSTSSTVYVDAVSVTDTSAAAHYVGQTSQSGAPAAGPTSATDHSGNPGFFSVNSVAFAFNNAGTANTGFEFSIPFADLGVTGEPRSGFGPSTFQAAAFVVSSMAYFSDVTVPGNVTAGNLGFGPDFNADLTGPACSCSANSAPMGTGPYHTADQPLGPPPTYVVAAPSAGALLPAGAPVKVRYTGPGVPDRDQTVDVFLRSPAGALTLVGSGPNLGVRKVTLPAGTPAGSGYSFRVVRADDATVVGESDAFSVTSASEQYTFASPTLGESWARGATHTVTWTAPPTAPAGGTVTIDFVRAAPGGTAGTLITSFPGEPDDGSFAFTVPAGQALSSYAFRITSDTDPAFGGLSPSFDVTRFEVTAPTVGTTWAAGSAQTLTWSAGGAATGTVKISLKKVGGGFNQSLGNNVAYNLYARNVTEPAAAPGRTYVVQLVFTATAPGGAVQTYLVTSAAFTVTNPLTVPPVVAGSRFGSAVASADARETVLVVRGLTEGAEVGVYAGEHLLATGVVEAGKALLAVPSEIAVDSGTGAEEWYFGETAALALRVYDGGATGGASAVEARRVTLGSDGSALGGVRMAVGDVVVVEASKGGAVSASSSVFAVAGVSPNPATTSATARFTSPSAVSATVVVYDLLGRVVETAFSGEAVEGVNEVSVSTGRLPAGVYVVRVTAGAESATTRVTVVR